MCPAFSALLRATALSGAILLTGGLEGPSQAQCGPDALGVSRTLMLTAESPPPYDLLEPGEVILTFDDGPATFRTKRVMKALDQECTRATFLLLGNEAEVRPGLAKDIREAGHTVGSHSLDHARLTNLSLAAAVENAEAGKTAVEAAIGQPTPLFRFPYVATNPELSQAIRAAGMIEVAVTADGADWTYNTPEEAVEMILAKLEQHGRRGMVLLHDPQENSAARTRLLLQELKEQGYRVVALEQPEG